MIFSSFIIRWHYSWQYPYALLISFNRRPLYEETELDDSKKYYQFASQLFFSLIFIVNIDVSLTWRKITCKCSKQDRWGLDFHIPNISSSSLMVLVFTKLLGFLLSFNNCCVYIYWLFFFLFAITKSRLLSRLLSIYFFSFSFKLRWFFIFIF